MDTERIRNQYEMYRKRMKGKNAEIAIIPFEEFAKAMEDLKDV